MKGLFISFEGPDASGKSTQIRLLTRWLEEKGREPLVTREPGGTVISEKIRELLLDPANGDMLPVTETLLYAASRAQHVGQVIRPALQAGRVVVSDRYLDSSIAYQGYGRNLGDLVSTVNAPAVDGVMPDLTVLLMTDPKEMRRRRPEEEEDRIEREGVEFQEIVCRGFLEIAEGEPERFLVIDGHRPVESIAEDIRRRVSALLQQEHE